MRLRPLQLGDWQQLHRLCTDPAVARELDEVPFQPAEVFRKRLEDLNPATALALAAEEDGDELVGALWLEISPVRRRAHTATLWMAVLPSHQRSGIGSALLDAALSAADRWLNLVRVEGDVDPDNAAILAMLEQRGFEAEARKKSARLRDGARADLLLMGRLRPGAAVVPTAPGPLSPGSPSRPLDRVAAIIRGSRLEDAEALAQISGEASVMWGTMQLPFPAVAAWKKRLEGNLAAPNHRHVLVAEVEGKTAGMLGLFGNPGPRITKVYHLGMSIHTELQGAGIGNQLMTAGLDLAHRWLGAWRVELEVYLDNSRAISLYEKHGFVREGIKRADAWRDGSFVDSLIMARLFE